MILAHTFLAAVHNFPTDSNAILSLMLIPVLAVVFLLASVVHAKDNGPADRLCDVLRAWRGLPSKSDSSVDSVSRTNARKAKRPNRK